jgi:nucleotide-binding universal stress UspA family protein
MRKILVALDDSPRAPHVLAQAGDLAQKLGGTLTLFRAVGIPRELPREAYVMSPEDVTKLLEARARQDLTTLQGELPPGVPSDIHVELGSASESICAVAARAGVDLIVIGSHGYTGLDHVLGTTAAKVVNHARTSVLVVR